MWAVEDKIIADFEVWVNEEGFIQTSEKKFAIEMKVQGTHLFLAAQGKNDIVQSYDFK